MSTHRQRAASRANGQKSQGPITPEGKTKSRFNALKQGIHAETQIMFEETAEYLAALTAELHEQYPPADATARFLVDTLIANEWRLRRMRRVEAGLWAHAAATTTSESPASFRNNPQTAPPEAISGSEPVPPFAINLDKRYLRRIDGSFLRNLTSTATPAS